MNNRGKKLTNLELLKNRLIYLTTLYDDNYFDSDNKTELRKDINETWKEIYYQLGRNTRTPLSDDDFLRAHWSVYFQYTRKKGNDYIKFLLDKFSNKNIFARKHDSSIEEFDDSEIVALDDYDDDILDENGDDNEVIDDNFLQPSEIMNYVNSLKGMAKYWYYTFFPDDSNELKAEEKLWIGRLNRIGINYFRPLVAVSMMPDVKANPQDRIELYKVIEKFIFLCFRMAMYQASYKSSYYYRKARELYFGGNIADLTKDILEAFSLNMDEGVNGFINKTSLRFKNGNGFYSWRDLKYFLYEYEYYLSVKNNIEKIDWSMFTKTEKDKVTIEHILPQTATKWYWKNQLRDYSSDEIKTLSGSLGNLLPLSQSINSKLQNIGFDEKKTSKTNGRRGYENGSHSEIEVSKKQDWNGEEILERGLHLLSFMEKRWEIEFMDNEQKIELLHLEFMNEERNITPEIPINTEIDNSLNEIAEVTDISSNQLDFWTEFNEYCKVNERSDDIGRRKPCAQNWYDVAVGGNGYHVFMQVLRNNTLCVGIYVYNIEVFERLEKVKAEIESYCGFELDWYSSKNGSKAKRIIHSKEADVFNRDLYADHFDWLISIVDKIRGALQNYDPKLN